MSKFETISVMCRRLLLSQSSGVLSTHCTDVEGFPFGSIIPYMVGEQGEVVTFVSDVARHTENVKRNPKVSLTVVEGFAGNIQNYKRLTYMGTMVPIESPSPDLVDRFFRYFPHLAGFKGVKGVSFYAINLVTVRYIGGKDHVGWILPDDFLVENPFIGDAETTIVEAMNKGSKLPLLNYCEYFKSFRVDKKSHLFLTGVDKEGIDLIYGDIKLRIHFSSPVETSGDLKKRLKEMAMEALEELDKRKKESS